MSHIIYAAKFEQTITHQHILLRRESQSHMLLRRESQSHIRLRRESQSHILLRRESIYGTSVTVILCLHVLNARRILLIFEILIIFSEY